MNVNRVDLNLLVYLDALLRERNVTQAANQLHLSQPAMSNGLRRLRELFDDPLLVRVGRRMQPTPRAEELAELGRTAEAAAAYDRLIAALPKSVRPRADKALMFQRSGDFAAAERAITRSLELNPNNAEHLAAQASIAGFSGHPEEAITAMELALQINPYPRSDALNSLAYGYFLVRRFEDVIALYDRYGAQAGEDRGATGLGLGDAVAVDLSKERCQQRDVRAQQPDLAAKDHADLAADKLGPVLSGGEQHVVLRRDRISAHVRPQRRRLGVLGIERRPRGGRGRIRVHRRDRGAGQPVGRHRARDAPAPRVGVRR